MGKEKLAYTAPFIIFMLLIALCEALDRMHVMPWGLEAKYLVFPIQTAVCAVAMARFWPVYRMGAPRKAWLAAGIGVLVFALWVSPQTLFHAPPRIDGFDPGVFAGRPGLYWGELVMRILRLVVVVPLLEEIFWRGFLLRFFVNEDFQTVPFGTQGVLANWVVAAGFMLEHSTRDWPAALAAGLLYNLVAYRTRSLSSCVLAHAITNTLLGAFILMTHQWGFW